MGGTIAVHVAPPPRSPRKQKVQRQQQEKEQKLALETEMEENFASLIAHTLAPRAPTPASGLAVADWSDEEIEVIEAEQDVPAKSEIDTNALATSRGEETRKAWSVEEEVAAVLFRTTSTPSAAPAQSKESGNQEKKEAEEEEGKEEEGKEEGEQDIQLGVSDLHFFENLAAYNLQQQRDRRRNQAIEQQEQLLLEQKQQEERERERAHTTALQREQQSKQLKQQQLHLQQQLARQQQRAAAEGKYDNEEDEKQIDPAIVSQPLLASQIMELAHKKQQVHNEHTREQVRQEERQETERRQQLVPPPLKQAQTQQLSPPTLPLTEALPQKPQAPPLPKLLPGDLDTSFSYEDKEEQGKKEAHVPTAPWRMPASINTFEVKSTDKNAVVIQEEEHGKKRASAEKEENKLTKREEENEPKTEALVDAVVTKVVKELEMNAVHLTSNSSSSVAASLQTQRLPSHQANESRKVVHDRCEPKVDQHRSEHAAGSHVVDAAVLNHPVKKSQQPKPAAGNTASSLERLKKKNQQQHRTNTTRRRHTTELAMPRKAKAAPKMSKTSKRTVAETKTKRIGKSKKKQQPLNRFPLRKGLKQIPNTAVPAASKVCFIVRMPLFVCVL